jgi:predicted DNA-binding transcriptional regulator YafY
MYSPTTRLLTLLELLQTHHQMSGPAIARRLEVDVRTVRRYVVMLQDMGIPVDAERGPDGAYFLRRGRRVPPLMFTDAEAVALTLGLMAIRELRFPVEVAAAEGALAKTERLIPEPLLQQVRSLQEAIAFNVQDQPVILAADLVVDLSTAVQQRRRVHLHYHAWRGEATERDFDPYGIVFNEGYWHTVGFCHLRQDVRTFRLDRIQRLDLGTQHFERPEDFDVVGHVTRSIAFIEGLEDIEVVLETTVERARQAFTPIMGSLEPTEQGVIFRRSATQLPWIAHVLISLDYPVRVIRPDELRATLRQLAERARALAEGPPGSA